MRINPKHIARLQSDIDTIRRLGGLGARANAISTKFGGTEWKQKSVTSVLRDFFGCGGAPGRRTSGSPVETSQKHAEHFTLYHCFHLLARQFSTCEAKCTADAYELYHYLAAALNEPKVGIEAAMFTEEATALATIKTVRCKRCNAPKLARKEAIAALYTCVDCEDSRKPLSIRNSASFRQDEPEHEEPASVARTAVRKNAKASPARIAA